MFSVKRVILLVCAIFIISFSVHAAYVESSKDTKLPPDEAVIVPLNKEGYTFIHENDHFEYYYKVHNGIFAVYDKRNGYTWKSGIDHDYDTYIEAVTELFIENNPDATDEEILEVARPFEEQLNDSREGIANSLIVLEYVNRLNVSRPSVQAGSSYKQFIIAPDLQNPGQNSVQERVANSMKTDDVKMVNNDPNHYRIDF